jgi:hypothetical protein
MRDSLGVVALTYNGGSQHMEIAAVVVEQPEFDQRRQDRIKLTAAETKS